MPHPQATLTDIVRLVLAEAGPGMIYGSDDEATCSNCGRLKSDAIEGTCKCGSSMEEYTARGLSNMGRLRNVTERG